MTVSLRMRALTEMTLSYGLGNLSIEGADEILDIVDWYQDILELLGDEDDGKDNPRTRQGKDNGTD